MPISLFAAESSAGSSISTSTPGSGRLSIAFISVLLVTDLLLVHRKPHEISFREAAIESTVWISIGVAFTGVIYLIAGPDLGGAAAGEYISGFLLEKSLSVDNVFIWAVIFTYFAVPKMYQFRVLF